MSKKSAMRQDEIMKQMISEGDVLVRELSLQFGVSEETIRQDLSRLESLGLCQRTHGGATVVKYSQVSTDIKASEHAQEKNMIARAAVNMMEDGSAVWIDPGSTMTAMARYLPLRKDLTVITNNLDFAQAARATRHEIIFLGGTIQKKGSCTTGAFAIENLSHVTIQTAFLGCDGFFESEGPTTFSFEEMELKQQVMKHAKRKILMCDSSKFSYTGSYIFAKYSQFDVFLTDALPETADPAVREIGDIITVS